MKANQALSVRPVLLIVDDEPGVRGVLSRFAERYAFEIVSCADGREAVEVMKRRHVDAALVDVRLPHVGGMEVLKAIRTFRPECHVILMSGATTVDGAVEAIRLGAEDYLTKPIDFERLSQLFARVCDVATARKPSGLEHPAESFHGLVGESPQMAEVCTLIERLAPHARVALITGETGTGKELAARALHEAGPRARQRFVAINCSAVVETLFESELFGHVKGAFTGAAADKAGLFEQAHRGTLFLDEIAELPPSMQAKLLRVLESGELLRVGALQPRIVDVHVVAATNRDLRAEVAAGRFRQDLLFRINMIEIALPPLRTRRPDILPLARTFAAHFATRMGKNLRGLTPDAEAALCAASWPGNVRELRNVIERACIVADGELLGTDDLPLEVVAAVPGFYATDSARRHAALAPDQPVRTTLAVIEREHLLRALDHMRGNKAKAADELGISRRAFYRRLEKHGLDRAIQRRGLMPLIDGAQAVAGAAA